MSSVISIEHDDPVAKLTMKPSRSILKSSASIDDSRLDHYAEFMSRPSSTTPGMTRSESKR
jgi:hypothetical protein